MPYINFMDGLAFLLLLLLGLSTSAAKICVIPASIQQERSTLKLTGDAPVGSLDSTGDPASIGGAVYFVLPTATCPTTSKGLAKQLQGAQISAPISAPAVILSKPELKARYRKLGITTATITMTGYQIQFAASNLTPSGTNTFTTPLRALGLEGAFKLEVLGQDAVTKPVASTDVVAEKPASVVVTATGLDMELPELELIYSYPLSSKAIMSGSLFATAVLADAKVYNLTDFPSAGKLPVVLAPPPPPLKAPAGVDVVCVVPIALDSVQSPIKIGGTVSAEGLGTFKLSQTGAATLTGFVYVVVPVCKCPTTPAQWAAALSKAVMFTPLDRLGVSTDPSSVKTEVGGGLATVAFDNIQIAVETKVPLSPAGTKTYGVSVVMHIVSGTVVPSMGSKPRSLANEKLSPANPGTLTLQGSALNLNYPGISLPVKDPGSADLTIQTAMIGSGRLSAAFPALASNFNASINATDGPCGVVSFPPPVAKSPPPVVLQPPALQTPEPEPAIEIGSSTGGPSGVGPSFSSSSNCPARMGPSDGSCGCTSGWYGGDCVTCQADDACSDWLDPTTSTCNTSFVFSPLTVYKAYTCSFTDKVIADLIPTASFICNVRGHKLRFENSTLGLMEGGLLEDKPAGTAGGKTSAGHCRMVASMKDQTNNPLVCTGTDCTFDRGKATGNCKMVSCYCPAGCPDIVNNIFTKITTISLQCPPTGGNCKLVADGLPLTPGMQCKVGECTLPDTQAQDLAKGITTTTRSWVPVIASVPLWVLGAVALACSTYLGIHKGLFALPNMLATAGNGKMPAAFAPGLPMAESSSEAELLGAAAASGCESNYDANLGHGQGHYYSSGPGPVAEGTDLQVDMRRGAPGGYREYAPEGARELQGGVGFPGADGGLVKTANRGCNNGYDYKQSPDQRLSSEAGVLVFTGITCTVWNEADSWVERVKGLLGGGRTRRKSKYQLPPGQDGVVAVSPLRERMGPQTKVLLDNVSGRAVEGQVTAVMGPSGSGKTTLLGVLSSTFQGLSDGTHITGHVSLCDETRRSVLSNVTAFVPQKDVLLPALTVAESLQYSALLRLPHNLSGNEIRERIAGVLIELGLAQVANSKVGGSSAIRGVSGGERRRVTIGMELVTSPRLIIMDEPTSGLDSYTSYNLLVTCKQVAQRGRIVLMSVHQPSPTMFYEFDSIMFLARGHVVYFGMPAQLEQYLEQAGYLTPRHTPVADHMLNLISESHSLQTLLSHMANPRTTTNPPPNSRSQKRLAADAESGQGPNAVSKRDVGQDVLLDSTAQQAKARSRMMPVEIRSRWMAVAHFIREVAVLFRRAFIQLVRTPSMLLLHTATAIIMGLLVGAVFYHLAFDTAGAQNRAGFLFFSLCLFGFTSLTIIDSLALERELVVREVKSRYYTISSYLIAKLTLDGLLLRVLPAIIYALITQFLVRLNPNVSKTVTYFFLLATFACTVGTLSLAMSAVFPQTSSALLVMNVILLLWVLMGGFLVNGGSIPLFLRWIRYVSPMSYVFEGLVTNEIKGQRFTLALDGVGRISDVDGVVLVKLIGLDPNRLPLDVTASVLAYMFTLLLAFACYALAVLPVKRWVLSFYPPPAKPSKEQQQQGS